MRRVPSTSALWWSGGIASTDIAALVRCGVTGDDNPLVKFAQKLWLRERKMRKEIELAQGTPEWHKKRLTGIGGTEAAALVGCSFANKLHPQQIWDEKTETVEVEKIENEHMARGKRLEPVARELYESLYGWKTPPLNIVHDNYDFVRASLDGIREDDKLIVEIKSMGQGNHSKALKLQDIKDPLERQTALAYYFNYYRMQMLYQLLISEAEVCHFVCYNEEYKDHRKLAVVEVYPEPKSQEILLQRVVEFWDFVEKRCPPDVEWSCYKMPDPTEIKVPQKSIL